MQEKFRDSSNSPLQHELSEYVRHAIGKRWPFGRLIEFRPKKPHFERCCTPNCQVNFWWFKSAMRKVGGIKIERTRAQRIVLLDGQRNSPKTDFLKYCPCTKFFFRGRSDLQKISLFHEFSCPLGKKNRQPAADSILMPPTFHIARLNRYTPNFSGVPQKLTWCQQFGLQIFPKWGDVDICRHYKEMVVFRCFK